MQTLDTLLNAAFNLLPVAALILLGAIYLEVRSFSKLLKKQEKEKDLDKLG